MDHPIIDEAQRPVPKPRPKTLRNLKEQVKPTPPPRPQKSIVLDSSCDSILHHRKIIESLVKENRPHKEKFEAACCIMRVQCLLDSKYKVLELLDLLDKNKDLDVCKIPQAFTFLEKYATNLLKDESSRHQSWSTVQFHSVFKSKVNFMIGSVEILKSLGYSDEIFDDVGELSGLSFPPGKTPNEKIIMDIAVDLIVAQFEVEAMIMGEHPRAKELQSIEDIPSVYFPPKEDLQSICHSTNQNSIRSFTSLSPNSKENISLVPLYHSSQSDQSSTAILQKEKKNPCDLGFAQITCPQCCVKHNEMNKYCSKCGFCLLSGSILHEEKKTVDLVDMLDGKQNIFKWNCEHCTFLNDSESNICVVCFKTSIQRKQPKNVPVSTSINDIKPSMLFDSIKLQEAKKKHKNEVQKKVLIDQENIEKIRNEIIKEQDMMMENGLSLVTLLKNAENLGYSMKEILFAQKILPDANQEEIILWLKNNWAKMIDESVLLSADDAFSQMTREEAKSMLINHNGNVKRTAEVYRTKRLEKIDQFSDLHFEDDQVLSASYKAKGNYQKTRKLLQRQLLEPLLHNLIKNLIIKNYDQLKDPNISTEVKKRTIMSEIGVSWGRADFVLRLFDKDVPGSTTEILEVIRDNINYNYEQCEKFFSHDCSICFSTFSHNNIYVSHYCNCEICWDCFKENLKVNIKENHIRHLYCPSCQKPDLDNPEMDTQQYFGNILERIKYLITKNELDSKIEEIFENKLLNFHLRKKQNFRYCNKCKNGFEWENPDQKKMKCTECSALMCFECRKDWMDQHEELSCEDFNDWLEANDPINQERGVAALLNESKIVCPYCFAEFELAKGGCMHMTCIECKIDFCVGCDQPLKRGGQCLVDKSCENKGLHSHCPRDCFSFLRDFTILDLEELLMVHNIQWQRDYPQDLKELDKKVCRINLQKEIGAAYKDEACGKDAPENMAGLCEQHYKEFLVLTINNNAIDPVEMKVINLNAILKRHFKPTLDKNDGESDDAYRLRLIENIKEQIPLPQRKHRKHIN